MSKKKNTIIFLIILFFILVLPCYAKGEMEFFNLNNEIEISMYSPYPQRSLENLIESKFPNIKFNCIIISDNYKKKTIERSLLSEDAADLIIFQQGADSFIEKYCLDLSSNQFVSRYSNRIMDTGVYNGKNYLLPFCGQYFGYILNQTLWSEEGFSIPDNDQKLIKDLKIYKEKNKINNSSIFTFSDSILDLSHVFLCRAIPDFFGTIKGVQWINQRKQNNVFLEKNLIDSLKITYDLIENSLIEFDEKNHEDFVKENGVLAIGSSSDFIQIKQSNKRLSQKGQARGFNYEFIPFLSEKGNKNWYNSFAKYYIGINKTVENDSKKMKACLDIFDLISTPSGQEALMDDYLDGSFSYLNDFEDSKYSTVNLNSRINVDDNSVYFQCLDNNTLNYIGKVLFNSCSKQYSFYEAIDKINSYLLNDDFLFEGLPLSISFINNNYKYDPYQIRKYETPLGDLCANAVKEELDVDIAFVNGGAIRDDLFKGEVFLFDLKKISPFNNEYLVLQVPGSVIFEMLQNSISDIFGKAIPSGRFLQISGMKFSYYLDQVNYKTQLLDCFSLDGKQIDKNKLYKIGISNYLCGAYGYDYAGDGYYMLNLFDSDLSKNDSILFYETNKTLYDCLINYFVFHENEEIEYRIDGRIEVIEE